MYWLARFSRGLLIMLLTTALMAATAAGAWAIRDHGRMLSIQTTSMVPVLHKGDAVIEQAVSTSALRVGDIVSYRSSVNPNLTITHRLVKIDAPHNQFITKGDHNAQADQPISQSQITGRAIATAPAFGRVLDFEHTWKGLILTIYLPAGLIMLGEMAHMYKGYQQPIYRLARLS